MWPVLRPGVDWCYDLDEDRDGMADAIPAFPNMWSDNSQDSVDHLDVEVAGAGVFTLPPALTLDING